MHHFHLISNILRSVWAIDSNEINSWLPQISTLLKGEILIYEEDKLEPLSTQFINSSGKTYYSSVSNLEEEAIAVFSIEGPMMKKGDWCSYGTEEIAAMMISAIENENVKGTILKFDTGGGTVDSVQPLVNAINKSKEAGKPVFAYVDHALSAGYKVACECDKIIATNKMATFGSIGVLVRFPNSDKYSKDVMGLEIIEIYAPESSDKNLPYRQAVDGKIELIQTEILSPYAKDFISSVKAARDGKLDNSVSGLLSGKVFFAEDSISNGLCDEIDTSFENVVNDIFTYQNTNQIFNTMSDDKKEPTFADWFKGLFGKAPVETQETENPLEAVKAEVNSLQTEKTTLISEVEKLKKEKAELEASNNKLKTDLEAANKTITEKDQEIETLKQSDGATSAVANTSTDPQLTATDKTAVYDENADFYTNFENVKKSYLG